MVGSRGALPGRRVPVILPASPPPLVVTVSDLFLIHFLLFVYSILRHHVTLYVHIFVHSATTYSLSKFDVLYFENFMMVGTGWWTRFKRPR